MVHGPMSWAAAWSLVFLAKCQAKEPDVNGEWIDDPEGVVFDVVWVKGQRLDTSAHEGVREIDSRLPRCSYS